MAVRVGLDDLSRERAGRLRVAPGLPFEQARGAGLAGVLVPALAVVALGVLWLALFDPITGFAPGTDAGVYLYAGQQLLHGVAPYRGVFDNKGPLLYLTNAVGLILGGGSFWGVFALEYGLLAASTVLLFRVLRRRVGWLLAGLAILFFVLAVPHIVSGDHEEEYGVVLQCCALFALARRPGAARATATWVAVGAAGAGALLLKPTDCGLWVALAICGLATARGRRGVAGRAAAGAAAGAALVIGPVLVYLALVGAVGAFGAAYIGFNVLYVGGHTLGDRLASLAFDASRISYAATAAVAVAWALTTRRLFAARRAGVTDTLALLAVVWLPVEIALSATSGYSRLQYAFPWLLPATLLLGLALVDLYGLAGRAVGARASAPRPPAPASAPARRTLRLAVVTTAALAALALGGLVMPAEALLHNLAGGVVHAHRWEAVRPQARREASFVDARTRAGSYVLVWGGYDATVNFLADRRSPSRYVMQLALYFPGYAPREVPVFLREIETHRPALVLDTSPSYGLAWGTAVPSLASMGRGWTSVTPAVARAWAPVFAWLHAHYRPAGRLPFPPGWPVYVPR